jgi:oligo-1,6-glucosidase
LNYFRKLVKLRKDNLVLVYGKYTLLDKENSKVYAYTREGEGEKMLILLNFSTTASTCNVDTDISNAKMLLTNYKDAPSKNIAHTTITLRPYEALVYSLK